MALSDYKEPYVLMKRGAIPDGIGGAIITWTEGEEFEAAVTQSISGTDSGETRQAEAQTVSIPFLVIAGKDAPIIYQSIIKRVSDGQYFRITGNPHDTETPKCARVQFMQCSAEKLQVLPDVCEQGELT